MANGIVTVPVPRNEPVLSYAPGAPERRALSDACAAWSKRTVEIAHDGFHIADLVESDGNVAQ